MSSPRQRRPRDLQSSRSDILDAAQAVFTEKGFSRATIREIARRADVANGLVLRHFTSKEALFVASFEPAVVLTSEHRPKTSRQVVEFGLEALRHDTGMNSFLAVIRTADTDPELTAKLREEIRARSWSALSGTDDDRDTRLDLFGAVMIGLTFVRDILNDSPLARCDDDELDELVRPILNAALRARPATE